MGRTFRHDKKWGSKAYKKTRTNKDVKVKDTPKTEKTAKDDFWDDPTFWGNDDFEKFNDKRGRRKGF